MTASARIGVDIGGTFTDIVLLSGNGRTLHAKVSSTPDRPEEAVVAGIRTILGEAGLDPGVVSDVLHGTTVGSNTLLQKTGARCGLITTRGFRDVLEIGRVRTPTMFDLSWEKPAPLVPRRYRLEVDERMAADGTVLRDLDEEAVEAAGRFFVAEGIESVAICFLNSYRNPANEARAAEVLASRFPELTVTASVAVLPEIREYERTSTVAVNAYVLPVLKRYLERLAAELQRIGIAAPLLVANSNGGLSTARLACDKPVFFISSGRSAGVVGAARLGEALEEPDLVVFDMGGTTASASLISNGALSRTSEYEFRAGISTPSRFIKAGGYMMRVPTIDVAEVGSGAGSIAAIDAGGLLTVGPLSAGAKPGPACYGSGGDRPTVTDANAVLGYLPPSLAGGSLALDLAAARNAIARDLGAPLGLDVEAAAHGVREVANINMARAIRAVTVERGVDPRDFTLLAFGGSGPVHACDLARTLGMRRVLFPRAPGVFTAMGMLAAAVERYFLRPCPGLLADLDWRVARRLVEELAAEGTAALGGEGYPPESVALAFEIDLRFRGQDSELPVPLPRSPDADDLASLRSRFIAVYRETYGYASDDDVEAVAIRCTATAVSASSLDLAAMAPEAPAGRIETRRPVFFGPDTGWIDTPVIDRSDLQGSREGPLVLESSDTTIVIPPFANASAGPAGAIVARLS